METQPGNNTNCRLIADVGGTNTRIALYDPKLDEIRALSVYLNRDYDQFEDVLSAWLESLSEPKPIEACIAVAAAPADDLITMLNINWSFSCASIARKFGFVKLNWINDFVAVAHALPYLSDSQTQLLHEGLTSAPQTCNRFATVGAGTGLGGAIIECGTGWRRASACEPGHIGLSPASSFEVELFELLLRQYDNLYAELIISGPGLQRLYKAICKLSSIEAAGHSPKQISAAALSGADAQCILALETFCALLGSACGNFLLANGAYGGLYLAGGIAPSVIPFVINSQFHQRLCAKGGMHEHLSKVPVHVITTPQPGLMGASQVQL